MTGTSFYSLEKVADGRSGGTTQAETRVYNERLVVALVRRHQQLSKSDLARLTGLAPQTVTTIVNRAAADQLLLRREPLRGRLGQPSVPYGLNPDAAFAFGLKIDHRSADLALINFVGDVVAFEQTELDYPTPSEIMTFAKAAIGRMRRKHKTIPAERIAGLGIASPIQQWSLPDGPGIPKDRLAAWGKIDIRAELDRTFDWPVYLFNDATMCAAAELMFGAGTNCADFLYAYVGYFLGGAVVLDHHLFPGRNRLAGALGEMPVHVAAKRADRIVTLRQVASIHSLASRLGSNGGAVWSAQQDWRRLGSALDDWIEEVADGISQAARNAVALLDVDNIVIDGAIPPDVRSEVAKAIRRKLARALADRPEPFSVLEGKFGHLGPAIGGASIPLLVKYSNDKELLFKD